MYYYIIDKSRQRDFEKIEPKIKEILTNFDILGEFIYAENVVDIPDIVKTAMDKGFSTIVAVGNDSLANAVAVNIINSKITLGILPLEDGILSLSLGLGNWKNACEILAARRVLLMDTGIVNDKTFVTEVLAHHSPDIAPQIQTSSIFSKILGTNKNSQTESTPVSINVNDEYEINSDINGLLISNLRPYGKDLESIRQSMIDNNLHISFSDKIDSGSVYSRIGIIDNNTKQSNISIFHASNFTIQSEKPLFFWSSGLVIARTPATFSLQPQSLKVISGRLR